MRWEIMSRCYYGNVSKDAPLTMQLYYDDPHGDLVVATLDAAINRTLPPLPLLASSQSPSASCSTVIPKELVTIMVSYMNLDEARTAGGTLIRSQNLPVTSLGSRNHERVWCSTHPLPPATYRLRFTPPTPPPPPPGLRILSTPSSASGVNTGHDSGSGLVVWRTAIGVAASSAAKQWFEIQTSEACFVIA